MRSFALLRGKAGRSVVTAAALCLLVSAAVGVSHAAGPTPGSVTSERLKLPSGPNSVRGLADEPRVDPFLAQVSHSVPLELPGGWGGLAPDLSLLYSGALGNGPLGIGWNMPGARIQRSLRLGVPRFDDTDELELSGMASGRLVSIGGSEYRIEGAGQTVRVRRVGGGFDVDDGNGTTSRFGISPAARHEGVVSGTTRTLAWLLEEQRNQAGELIRYEYDHDRGQAYLRRIVWGPGEAFSVELEYESRPDVVSSYREGFRVVTGRRLTELTVQAFGVERRSYQLHYDETFSVSRLAGVSSTGREREGAWPALTFDYATTASSAAVPVPGVQSWRLNVSGITLVDLNGDGAAELVQLADGGHSFRSNQDGTFGAVQLLRGNTQSITTLQLQDIDGDARADLLLDTGDGWAVWKYAANSWVPQAAQLPDGTWPGTEGLALKNPSSTRFADLNGDGLVDAIRWDNDDLKIHQATLSGFSPPREVGRIGGAVLPTDLGRFQDTNGDGLDDYIELQIDRLDVYIGRGDGTFDAAAGIAYPFPGDRPNPSDLHLVDLDRDGLTDLVRVDLGAVRWYRGKADGTFAQTPVTVGNPEPLTADVVVAIADVNGNGSQDVIWSSPSGMWRMDVAGATTAGMLVRTRNGLGMDVSFTYLSSHALSAEARQAGDPWLHEVPIAMPVPVEKTTALGPGETVRKLNYVVRDGYWDVVERRFAGFLGTIVTTWGATPAETSSVQTRFHNGAGVNRVLRGKVLTEQVRDGTGRRLSLTTHAWETKAVAGLPDLPLLRRATLRETRTRHEDTTPIRETKETLEYDEFGRVSRAVDQGRLDLDHDGAIRESRYADDATTWVRDRLCEEKVLESDGTLVSHKQYLSGDENQVHPLCVVGKGWPRATLAWLADESRFVSQQATSYDVRGNPVSIVEGGVTRTLGYEPDGLFPVSESVVVGSLTLTWTATWDRVLGVVATLSEPNGHEVHVSYDNLGRFTGLSLDDRAPHMVVEYDWSDPSPKTTVWEFDGAPEELAPWPGTWAADARWRQSVEVANGRGEVRYRAVRLAEDGWIISDYRERDPNSRVVFAGQPVYSSELEHAARPGDMVGNQLFYDPLGRLLEQRLPTGASRVFRYTAFERTVEEDGLAPVHSVLDGQGRVILTDRQLANGTYETVEASYDAADRITELRLQGGLAVHSYSYDTLGRLVYAHDDDIGARTLLYDDGDRLISATNGAGQTVTYSYDDVGRLIEERAGDGASYIYHYDAPRNGEPAGNLKGRLAWVEEPTGFVALAYSEFGHPARRVRTVDGKRGEEFTRTSPSGLVLGTSCDDGFAIDFAFNPAGRVIGAGTLWSLEEQDAAGNVLRERFGNGVTQDYERDSLGLPSAVVVERADGTGLYDVGIERNEWLAIEAVTDRDGHGLDHTATFGYDPQGRLTTAAIGQGAAVYQFGYTYDALQNMTSRQAVGPKVLNVLTGDYRYGEGGRGPRQLTSIQPAGAPAHTFQYDAAGRLRIQDGLSLHYDGLDQLLRVDGFPTGSGQVQYAYGHDGQRIKTVSPNGAVTYWFSESATERDGVREHVVSIGARALARVTGVSTDAAAPPSGIEAVAGPVSGAAMTLWAVMGLLLAIATRSRAARRLPGGAALFALVQLSCSSPNIAVSRAAVWNTQEVLYFHAGVSAGPTLFTREDGSVASERRYEPFGAPIEAYVETEAGPIVVDIDFAAIDHNSLAKRTDSTSGWSYHGARWMAPEVARWLTPDPPVKTPNPEFLDEPWGLHPYQYVRQNPIVFWDPDGRNHAAVNRMANVSGPCAGCPSVNTLKWSAQHQRQPPPAALPNQRISLDDLQAGLDAASLVDQTPLTNIGSAGISILRGDWKGAGLSAAAAILTITVVGDELVEGVKVGRGIAARKAPRFEVTPSGVAIPTSADELTSNMRALTETSTNPSSSRKFVGTDSQGPLRVRVERAHPVDPNFTGTPDPLHTVDHLHLDRRANGETGHWSSSEKVSYEWPF
jgi:RHS repeat-associated protein